MAPEDVTVDDLQQELDSLRETVDEQAATIETLEAENDRLEQKVDICYEMILKSVHDQNRRLQTLMRSKKSKRGNVIQRSFDD